MTLSPGRWHSGYTGSLRQVPSKVVYYNPHPYFNVLIHTLDTTPMFNILKGFRTSNVEQFKSGIYEMDKARYGPSRRRRLCSKLATTALANRDAKILEALLEVHGDNDIEWFFERDFDTLKHEGHGPVDAEIVRIVENSSFKSMVPPGERFRYHPLDVMK
jgi:hypothetical protein